MSINVWVSKILAADRFSNLRTSVSFPTFKPHKLLSSWIWTFAMLFLWTEHIRVKLFFSMSSLSWFLYADWAVFRSVRSSTLLFWSPMTSPDNRGRLNLTSQIIILFSVSTAFVGFSIFVATISKDYEAAAAISAKISLTGRKNAVGYCSTLDDSLLT